MSDSKTFEGLVVRRERLRNFYQGTSYEEVVLAIQVMDGDGIEKGMVVVENFSRYSLSTTLFSRLLLLRPGHTVTVPYSKAPGGPVQILPLELQINPQQFAKDYERKQKRKDAPSA